MSEETPSPQEIINAILTLVEEEAPKHTKPGERFNVTYGTVAQFSGEAGIRLLMDLADSSRLRDIGVNYAGSHNGTHKFERAHS